MSFQDLELNSAVSCDITCFEQQLKWLDIVKPLEFCLVRFAIHKNQNSSVIGIKTKKLFSDEHGASKFEKFTAYCYAVYCRFPFGITASACRGKNAWKKRSWSDDGRIWRRINDNIVHDRGKHANHGSSTDSDSCADNFRSDNCRS